MWQQLNGVAAAGTGAINVPLPVGWAAGDVCLMFCETNPTEAVAAPSGWTEVTGSPVVQNTTPAHRLTVFERRLTGSETDPIALADPGDHIIAQITAFRGALTTGLIVSNVVTGLLNPASSSFLMPTISVNAYDYVIAVLGSGDDSANLKVTVVDSDPEQIMVDASYGAATSSGSGGGFSLITGIAEKTGNIDSIVGNLRVSMTATMMVIALTPDPSLSGQLDVFKMKYGAIVETAPSDEIQVSKMKLGFIVDTEGDPTPPATFKRRWRANVN